MKYRFDNEEDMKRFRSEYLEQLRIRMVFFHDEVEKLDSDYYDYQASDLNEHKDGILDFYIVIPMYFVDVTMTNKMTGEVRVCRVHEMPQNYEISVWFSVKRNQKDLGVGECLQHCWSRGKDVETFNNWAIQQDKTRKVWDC